jgi:hypothetical protein
MSPINPITNPNPVYSDTHTRYNILCMILPSLLYPCIFMCKVQTSMIGICWHLWVSNVNSNARSNYYLSNFTLLSRFCHYETIDSIYINWVLKQKTNLLSFQNLLLCACWWSPCKCKSSFSEIRGVSWLLRIVFFWLILFSPLSLGMAVTQNFRENKQGKHSHKHKLHVACQMDRIKFSNANIWTV